MPMEGRELAKAAKGQDSKWERGARGSETDRYQLMIHP